MLADNCGLSPIIRRAGQAAAQQLKETGCGGRASAKTAFCLAHRCSGARATTVLPLMRSLTMDMPD